MEDRRYHPTTLAGLAGIVKPDLITLQIATQ